MKQKQYRRRGVSPRKPNPGQDAPATISIGMIILCLIISGCASTQFEQLKKKLIRQKKEKIQPVRFLDEPVRRKNSEYYKEHFLYFHTWNDTLIEFLGKNRKREIQAVREAERHLISLPKYLEPEYSEKLQALAADYQSLTAPLHVNSLPRSRESLVVKGLRRLETRVRRDFAFSEIKDHLLPDPTRIDLSAYEEEVPEEVAPEEVNAQDETKESVTPAENGNV
ncbi:MAG: hypothetical protein HY587_07795 [Candidatus Omnitrophica bacterium]|nr:hypothetical protein [Candidatus Omnitrophota bacterium]